MIDELKELGILDISKIIYCEWSKEDGFYYKTYADCINNNRDGYKN